MKESKETYRVWALVNSMGLKNNTSWKYNFWPGMPEGVTDHVVFSSVAILSWTSGLCV